MLTIRVDRVRSPGRCAFCHEATRDAVVPCAGCGTRLHAECWTLADRSCPTLGCVARRRVRPPAVRGFSDPARRFVARWLATILGLWSVSLAGTYAVGSDVIVVPALATPIAFGAGVVLAALTIREALRPRWSFGPARYFAVSCGAAFVFLGVVGHFVLTR